MQYTLASSSLTSVNQLKLKRYACHGHPLAMSSFEAVVDNNLVSVLLRMHNNYSWPHPQARKETSLGTTFGPGDEVSVCVHN